MSYLALIGFVAFMVGTPGPANLIIMIAGARFGIHQCFGFIIGVITGKIALNLFIGFGFGVALANAPLWQMGFSYISAGYMIWLAVRSWPTARNSPASGDVGAKCFRFRDGVLIHPMNPKAWVMCVLAWSNFAPALGDFTVQLPVIIITFALCQLVFHSLWCWLGEVMNKSFANSVLLTRIMIISTVIIVLVAVTF